MKTSHDLSGLIKFLGRDDWKDCLQDVMGDHFGPAMEEFDLEYDEIGDLLGDHWTMTLWGCAFEDFLTQTFDPGGRNLVDDYLKRRGWKESVQAKAYMKALRTSVMSLYEVSEIVPSKSFLARDLIRGGEPVSVGEGTATKTLEPWERIAARIVQIGDKLIIAGGLLPFSPEASAMLLEGLRDAVGKQRSRTRLSLDDGTLRVAAPLFTNAWLFDVLPKALGEVLPDLRNRDGEEIVFHEVRFPLSKGVAQKDIAVRLDGVSGLVRENAQFWNWLDKPASKPRRVPKDADAIAWDVTMEDGVPVLGNVELKGRLLLLSVNAASRAAKGTELLANALGELVRPPLTTIQTLEQMLEARPDREPPPDIPPEIATKLVHEMRNKQYRAILDEPVGMLGDISPRNAIRTSKGQKKVAEWLKYLENRSANSDDPADPMATYDFGWIWRELKVENLRR